MIQLIAIDLDGTLLHEDKTLSKGNIEALHRAHEAGYDIVICTGRPLAGVRPIFEEIGLPDGNYYMIINNGCTTLSTKNWEIISKEELSLEDMHRLQVLTEDTDVQLTLFDMDHYLVVAPEASELVTMDAGIVNSMCHAILIIGQGDEVSDFLNSSIAISHCDAITSKTKHFKVIIGISKSHDLVSAIA